MDRCPRYTIYFYPNKSPAILIGLVQFYVSIFLFQYTLNTEDTIHAKLYLGRSTTQPPTKNGFLTEFFIKYHPCYVA